MIDESSMSLKEIAELLEMCYKETSALVDQLERTDSMSNSGGSSGNLHSGNNGGFHGGEDEGK